MIDVSLFCYSRGEFHFGYGHTDQVIAVGWKSRVFFVGANLLVSVLHDYLQIKQHGSNVGTCLAQPCHAVTVGQNHLAMLFQQQPGLQTGFSCTLRVVSLNGNTKMKIVAKIKKKNLTQQLLHKILQSHVYSQHSMVGIAERVGITKLHA